MDKIFLDSLARPGSIKEIKGYNKHHLSVAGFRDGDSVIIGDKNFREFNAEIIESSKDKFLLKIKDEINISRVPPRNVTLFISLPKRKKIEDIIFKCTQLGVKEFIPIISSRTVKKINDRQREKNYERWEKKIKKAAELSMRKTVPNIGEILKFEEALKKYKNGDYSSGLIFWEQDDGQKFIKEADLSGEMAVFIGPEGGFNSQEIEKARKSGLQVRTLGSLILDVETASVAVVSKLLCRKD